MGRHNVCVLASVPAGLCKTTFCTTSIHSMHPAETRLHEDGLHFILLLLSFLCFLSSITPSLSLTRSYRCCYNLLRCELLCVTSKFQLTNVLHSRSSSALCLACVARSSATPATYLSGWTPLRTHLSGRTPRRAYSSAQPPRRDKTTSNES